MTVLGWDCNHWRIIIGPTGFKLPGSAPKRIRSCYKSLKMHKVGLRPYAQDQWKTLKPRNPKFLLLRPTSSTITVNKCCGACWSLGSTPTETALLIDNMERTGGETILRRGAVASTCGWWRCPRACHIKVRSAVRPPSRPPDSFSAGLTQITA